MAMSGANANGGPVKILVRHRDDEDDVTVPLILDRGERERGVAHHR